MTRYWVSKVASFEPFTLHSERMVLSSEEGESLRRRMAELHPRLLPSFKLSLFTGGDADICGPDSGEAGLHLDVPGAIVLEGALQVSHCGLAFLDRLLDAKEAFKLSEGVREDEGQHVDVIRLWWKQGYPVILLKEE